MGSPLEQTVTECKMHLYKQREILGLMVRFIEGFSKHERIR